jgi:hypothetical protein
MQHPKFKEMFSDYEKQIGLAQPVDPINNIMMQLIREPAYDDFVMPSIDCELIHIHNEVPHQQTPRLKNQMEQTIEYN